ncbi:MAG: hypothetical protein NTV49_05745, partial [Kiritimatiellaeota bacterium]|nr:hypothetical protein [Kiritimatiellota bacterium]
HKHLPEVQDRGPIMKQWAKREEQIERVMQSTEALLSTMLPWVLQPVIPFRCLVFEGKQDLEKQMVRRIRGYQKISGSRAVGPHLDLANTRSPSFVHFVKPFGDWLTSWSPVTRPVMDKPKLELTWTRLRQAATAWQARRRAGRSEEAA